MILNYNDNYKKFHTCTITKSKFILHAKTKLKLK